MTAKTIETARLRLTPWTEDMAHQLYEYAKNEEVGPAAGWKPHENLEESQRIIKELFMPAGAFAIILKDSGKIIGSVGFEPDKRRPGIASMELGYALSKDYWGRGIMTEAAKAVINYGFRERGLELIAICTGRHNERSQSIIKKCGFVYEGTERKAYLIYDGTRRDSMCFSLLREEWESLDYSKDNN